MNLLKLTAILISVTCVYLNHFDNPFHFDDSHTISDNPFIRDLGFLPDYFRDAGTFSVLPANQSYRPLVTASLALDYYLAGGYDNLFYFHLSTFCLFLLQLTLMFFFFRSLLRGSSLSASADNLSLIAVAVYGLHPVMAETVNYVIQRADLHSTLGVVAGFALYTGLPSLRKFHLYLIPVVLGALSKPPAVMFAPVFLAYCYLLEEQGNLAVWRGENRKALLQSVKKSAPAFIVCAALYLLQSKLTPASWVAGGGSALNYIATQPYVWLYYLKSFFLPTELHIDIDLKLFQDLTGLNAVLGYVFVLAIFTYLYRSSFSTDGKIKSFLIVWILCSLAPTTFIPLAEPVNDHRMFFPYVALPLLICMIAKSYCDRLRVPRPVTAGFVTLILGALAFGTYNRNEIWGSGDTIWKEVTEKSPQNGRGLMNYGLTRMSVGDFRTALYYFERAHPLLPNYPHLEVNLGIVKNALNMKDQVEKHFIRAALLSRNNPNITAHYAKWLIDTDQPGRAVEILNQSLAKDPRHLRSRHLLMPALVALNDIKQLEIVVDQTLAIFPSDEMTLLYKESIPNQ